MSENKIKLCVRHDFGKTPMGGILTIYEGEFSTINNLLKHVEYCLANFPVPLLIDITMLSPLNKDRPPQKVLP